MPGVEQLKSLLSRSQASGSKSTVMSDLRWFVAILLAALVFGKKYEIAYWLQVVIAIILGLAAMLYLGVYVYFAIQNPDALRSETFSLRKMEIEKTIIGDNIAGFATIDPTSRDAMPMLEPPQSSGKYGVRE
jgi:hypothetical protein